MDTTPLEPDRPPADHSPRRISAADADALRIAFEHVFHDDRPDKRPESEDELRLVLRDACVRARQQNVRAEQLLVSIKQIWAALPAPRIQADTTATDSALARVVSLCVDEYYGAADS